eukprot:2981602-Alexandrium_andersonii.AAC.1
MHMHHWLKPAPDSPVEEHGKLSPLVFGKADDIAAEFSSLLSDDALGSDDVWGALAREVANLCPTNEENHSL